MMVAEVHCTSHFEVRTGRLLRHACNPWGNNPYTSFVANFYSGLAVEAVFNVSVPPDQLTLNRVELHTMGTGNDAVRVFDFCEDNLDHSLEELENPLFEDILVISPGTFNSLFLGRGEQATYGFHFISLHVFEL